MGIAATLTLASTKQDARGMCEEWFGEDERGRIINRGLKPQVVLDRVSPQAMSINRVQFCVGRLETARLSITKATDVEHVQGLRRRYGNDE